MSKNRARFVIIGGGIIGSSIAYRLAVAGHAADVTVVEPDPTYEFAATARSSGGVRQASSIAENVAISKFGLAFYKGFDETMAVDGEPASVELHQEGYLSLLKAGADLAKTEARLIRQRALGVEMELLDAAEVRARYPALSTEDIAGATFSPTYASIDPYGALMGFRRKAISLGVTYLKDKVVGLGLSQDRVTEVKLQSGRSLESEAVVNCANAWAPEICAMAGIEIPVAPLRRASYFFTTREPVGPLTRIKDTSGVSFRSEGEGFATGFADPKEKPGFDWAVDEGWFHDEIWPRLAHRVPAFESLKLQSSWIGIYDMNHFDHQPILGSWPGGPRNFHLAAGFSGHGLQSAPAVGLGMAELLTEGKFQTLDLGHFSGQRVFDERPLKDGD